MGEMNDGFYVMAFASASHSIQTEKKAREQFKIMVIPTPEELSNDCGLTIKFLDGDYNKIKAFSKTLKIPADVYFLGYEKINGKRMTKKLI